MSCHLGVEFTAVPVAAEEVNGLIYNRAVVGWGMSSVSASFDTTEIDGDLKAMGFGVEGVVAENVFLRFTYDKGDGDIDVSANGQSGNLDAESIEMGFTFGYRIGLAPGTDLVPLIEYIDSSTKVDGESEDDTFTVYGLRLNTRLSESVQATFGFKTDGKGDEYGKTYEIGALFKVQQNFGLGARYVLNENDISDSKTWVLTAEYLF